MARRNRGILFVISGPSGAGKGTLRKILFDRFPDLPIPSPARHDIPRRRAGRHRLLVRHGRGVQPSPRSRRISRVGFSARPSLRNPCRGCATRAGAWSRRGARDRRSGALSIRDACPDAVLIFIAPPSVDELSDRLRSGVPRPRNLSLRLRNAMTEMEMASKYDHVILNDNVERAAEELIALVESYRNPKEVQS